MKNTMLTRNVFNPAKSVVGSFENVDKNAFSVMNHFKALASSQGWKQPDIKRVIDKAMKGDYRRLITVLNAHMSKPE